METAKEQKIKLSMLSIAFMTSSQQKSNKPIDNLGIWLGRV